VVTSDEKVGKLLMLDRGKLGDLELVIANENIISRNNSGRSSRTRSDSLV
jgi:hypothetical protein